MPQVKDLGDIIADFADLNISISGLEYSKQEIFKKKKSSSCVLPFWPLP